MFCFSCLFLCDFVFANIKIALSDTLSLRHPDVYSVFFKISFDAAQIDIRNMCSVLCLTLSFADR